MVLRRLLQILFAGFLGKGVIVVTQLLVPPFLLHYYGNGVSAYGEWLALSASVNFPGMFNYGIQSYANNEMTIRYNAGWLKMQQVTPFLAQLTLYLLILQITTNMLFTLVANSFKMVGLPHRGNYWASGQRLFSTFGMATAIYLHGSFAVLAGVQLGSTLLFTMLVLINVKISNPILTPILTPSLRYGTWRDTIDIMKPSGQFGLISLGGFLT